VSGGLNAIFGPVGANIRCRPGSCRSGDAGSFKGATPDAAVYGSLTPAQGVTGVQDTDFFVMDKATPGNHECAVLRAVRWQPSPESAWMLVSGNGARGPAGRIPRSRLVP